MLLYVLLAIALVVVFRRDLFGPDLVGRDPALRGAARRPHGFYRLFAFEFLLALLFLNAPAWFAQPFAPRQLAAWLLLLVSAGLAGHGFWMLRRVGRPAGPIEHTTRLVTTGAYRYIRHPLYTSLLAFGLGAFLKAPSLPGAALLALAAVGLLATARAEEAEMLARFGSDYAGYMRRSKRFVPFVFALAALAAFAL